MGIVVSKKEGKGEREYGFMGRCKIHASPEHIMAAIHSQPVLEPQSTQTPPPPHCLAHW